MDPRAPRPPRGRAASARASWLLLALGLAGCSTPAAGPPGAGGPDAGAPEEPCAPGTLRLESGSCQPAGLPPEMPCPPGEVVVSDGRCRAAGVPPDGCGEGFAWDGRGGCEVILPAPCLAAQVAVPGDSTCRDIAACGLSSYGIIPVDADTQHVNAAYRGGDSDGSRQRPWTRIQDGIDAVKPGGIVAVAAGRYLEDVVVDGKPATVWGRCPGLVDLSGVGERALSIRGRQARGSVLRGVAITGPGAGVRVDGSEDILLDRVRIHATGARGLEARHPATVTLRDSLVEDTRDAAVAAFGGRMRVERTVVRRTRPNQEGKGGRGIGAQPYSAAQGRPRLEVVSSVIDANTEVGIYAVGSDVHIEDSVVRRTRWRDTAGGSAAGFGIFIGRAIEDRLTSVATIARSLVEQSHEAGISVRSSDVVIESTVVRGTRSNASGLGGEGVLVSNEIEAPRSARATLKNVLVDGNREGGVSVVGADASIEATVVRGTLPNERGSYGVGINAAYRVETLEAARVDIRGSVVEDNHHTGIQFHNASGSIEATRIQGTRPGRGGYHGYGILAARTEEIPEQPLDLTILSSAVEGNRTVGVLLSDMNATLESTVVRDTAPELRSGMRGMGIAIQSTGLAPRSPATITLCAVERSHEAGIWVFESDVAIEGAVVRDTRSNLLENASGGETEASGGDGMAVIGGDMPSAARLHQVLVEGSARAGLASFGAVAAVRSSAFRCNRFSLDGEVFGERQFSFDGSGENHCACEGWTGDLCQCDGAQEGGECSVKSRNVVAPTQALFPPP
ncbi:uncharacterized protein SOCE26_010900 [Sorangium cellulosum]|uniref:Right handed beta helix domain-containing protein n=1 Tax=Sorangium cellulosum TaxID=56 RepID=A0A2L0EK68_SORCE|nr:right-handed parallel beta-helix repeat-containing protein [Sorangium cellulosum]AUX39695.1 uncharacterized protein SOCE26_010900 [Sorangium cellulosum]